MNRAKITAGAVSACAFFFAVLLLASAYSQYFRGFETLGIKSGSYIYYALFFVFSIAIIPLCYRFAFYALARKGRRAVRPNAIRFFGTLVFGLIGFHLAMYVHREAMVDRVVLEQLPFNSINRSELKEAVGFDLVIITRTNQSEVLFRRDSGRRETLERELKARGFLTSGKVNGTSTV